MENFVSTMCNFDAFIHSKKKCQTTNKIDQCARRRDRSREARPASSAARRRSLARVVVVGGARSGHVQVVDLT